MYLHAGDLLVHGGQPLLGAVEVAHQPLQTAGHLGGVAVPPSTLKVPKRIQGGYLNEHSLSELWVIWTKAEIALWEV